MNPRALALLALPSTLIIAAATTMQCVAPAETRDTKSPVKRHIASPQVTGALLNLAEGDEEGEETERAPAPPPDWVLRVRVVRDSGEPVVGVRMHAVGWSLSYLRSAHTFPHQHVTDADGRVTLEVDVTQVLPLEVRTANHARLAVRTVRKEEAAGEVVIVVPTALTVRGRVVDAEGRPVAGALVGDVARIDAGIGLGGLEDAADKIEVIANSLPDGWAEQIARAGLARSNAAGEFTLEGASGSRARIVAAAPHAVTGEVRLEKRDEQITIALDAGAMVEGVVRDLEGAPLPGVVVEVDMDGRGWAIRRAESDASGLYRVGGLRAGRYVLTVSGALTLAGDDKHGHKHGRSTVYGPGARRLVTVDPVDTSVNCDIVAPGPPVTVSGRMTIDGEPRPPAASAYIHLQDERIHTEWVHDTLGFDGKFAMEASVGPGRYILATSAGRQTYLHRAFDVPSGVTAVALEADFRSMTVEGVAVDESGRGVPGLTVWAKTTAPRDPLRRYGWCGEATTAEDGTFRVVIYDDEPHDLVVDGGYQVAAMGSVGPVRGGENSVRVVVGPVARIAATVCDDAGAPLPTAYVMATDRRHREHEEDGRGALLSLSAPAGTLDVVAGAPGRAFERRSGIRATGNTHMEFRLGPESVIEVRALDSAGRPVIDAYLELSLEDGSPAPDWTWSCGNATRHLADIEGRMRWDGLAAGRYVAEVVAVNGRRARLVVDVGAKAIAKAEVTLP